MSKKRPSGPLLKPVALSSFRNAGRVSPSRLNEVRVLMYSHDTFGLGHLRRCRTVAHSLAQNFKGVHILIISGSQIAGAFDFKARVDFVKIPGVIKLYNGEYTSISQHIDIRETLRWRQEIIRSTAKAFDPDMLIVDKEPIGLQGELLPTLRFLQRRNCRLVLGLREVMDDPDVLVKEWKKRDVIRHMQTFYDDIWVYGPKAFHNPLAGTGAPAALEQRLQYTGFLRREEPNAFHDEGIDFQDDYILVTAGGGGDGAQMMRSVLAAQRAVIGDKQNMLLVLGPFMPKEDREDIRLRADGMKNVRIIDFHNRHEVLIQKAKAVVSMAGYNTFCEILSLNKRALLIPRMQPRLEQLIRATRAAELGLVDIILPGDAEDPARMSESLAKLAVRRTPEEAGAESMLNGLDSIRDLVRSYFADGNRREVFLPPAAE